MDSCNACGEPQWSLVERLSAWAAWHRCLYCNHEQHHLEVDQAVELQQGDDDDGAIGTKE